MTQLGQSKALGTTGPKTLPCCTKSSMAPKSLGVCSAVWIEPRAMVTHLVLGQLRLPLRQDWREEVFDGVARRSDARMT